MLAGETGSTAAAVRDRVVAEEEVGGGEEGGAAVARGPVDYAALYRTFCSEAHCRVNSAVQRLLSAQPHRPLVALSLSDNYVGPKGLGPVLRLIEKCQTLEEVNLQGNGLDSAAITSLCGVLAPHLGVSSVDVSRNPFTLEGGRALMHLVSVNPRIIRVNVEGADILDSLAQRLEMAVAANHKAATGRLPTIVAAPRPLTPRVSSAAAAKKHVAISPVPRRRRPETAEGGAGSSRGVMSGGGGDASAGGEPRQGGGAPPLPARPATSGPLHPRPPAPAIAAREAARLSEARREELRQRYRRRAEAYHGVTEKSAAAQMADTLRQELALLEAADARRQRPPSASGVPQRPPSGAQWTRHVRALAPADAAQARDTSNHATQPPSSETLPRTCGGSSALRTPSVTSEEAAPEAVAAASPVTEPNTILNGSIDAECGIDRARFTAPPRAEPLSDAPPPPPARRQERRQPPAADVAGYIKAPMVAEEEAAGLGPGTGPAASTPKPQCLVAVGAAEQFRALFDLGCSQYNDRQLDAAYLTWQEAMTIATQEKSREWMSIITQNLRRLSFEMRAADGMKHLDAMRLDEADAAFADALSVAVKARNAAWETEMRRAIKNVMHTRFQVYHKDATTQLEEYRNYKDEVLRDDDDRVVPALLPNDGSTVNAEALVNAFGGAGNSAAAAPHLQQRTTFFFNEWNRSLKLKSAVELWTDCVDIAGKIGGSSSRVLLDVVSAAMRDVCKSVWALKVVPDVRRDRLPRFGMHELRFDEAKMLTQLWIDLFARSKSMGVSAWNCVCHAHLGHLAIAVNSLSTALTEFNAMLNSAVAVGDVALEAAARTYLGLVHVQRADYALADGALSHGVRLWRQLREAQKKGVSADVDTSVPQESRSPEGILRTTSTATASVGGSSSPTPNATGDAAPTPNKSLMTHFPIAVARDVATTMETLCSEQLVVTLIGCHRYRRALEVHEAKLLHRHDDVLRDKIRLNFTDAPTIDHIAAVARSLGSPLIYMTTAFRFEFDAEAGAYEALEQLLVWVVPPGEADIKFVAVDVTCDFAVPSLATLIAQAREALRVDPNRGPGAADNDMLLTVPELQWKQPLMSLHQILIGPIFDFLQVHVGYSECGLINIIPDGCLWALPFAALLDERTDAFLVEQFALSCNFCAVQAALAILAATRVRARDAKRRVIVGAPCETDAPTASIPIELPFALDVNRCAREAELLRPALGADAEVLSEGATNAVALREVLPACRVLHIASPISSAARHHGNCGGMCVAVQFDQLGLFHAAEIEGVELPAELVMISNSNVPLAAASRGAESEGSLCFFRALMDAGACAVLGSLWCTPDMTPGVLLEKFLFHARTEPSKPRALSFAIRGALAEDGLLSPRMWAGLVFFGVGSL